MATGTVYQSGGVMAPSDVPYAGVDEWSRMSGMSPMSPLVGGPGVPGGAPVSVYSVGERGSRIVTNGTTAAPAMDPHGPGVALLDDWRDVFNFRGSPVPWLLLFSVVMLGLMQLRVSARAGRAKGDLSLG
jgi:hypothetical protein